MRIPQPATKEQADAGAGNFTPWPSGTYDFEIHDASEEISKASGAEMIKLTIYIFNADGDRRTVFDYLLSSRRNHNGKPGTFAKPLA